jgi:epoxyqueuosine reductase
MTTVSLTSRIKDEARRLGFDPVGVTGADPLAADRERLWSWLAAGHHGSMAYMARDPDLRADPGRLLPGARSAVVMGFAYAAPEGRGAPAPAGEGSGARVARYARGRDYHRVIRHRLRRLEASIGEIAGRPLATRSFVDTGPVLERALAVRAGLGFIGKNTLLIHPRHGSYLFLAVILTVLELAPDEPSRADCGSCRLCIDACPTQALDTPYTLAATRCLSYLTIEERGAIDPMLRPSVGGWAFGCDACQEACPYNRRPAPCPEPLLDPRHGVGERLPLEEVLAMTARGPFLARFAGTPLTRPRREGLVRNACLAAAHERRLDLVPLLAELLRADPSRIVRAHAAWALRRLGGAAAHAALSAAWAGEPDPEVRAEL